jgi:hypothetical protein
MTDRRGRPTTRQPGARPGVEPLEDRYLPSAAAVAAAPPPLPFQEHLTVVSVEPTGAIDYVGNATHLGRLTAVLNPDDTFTKTAADGATLSGYVTPQSATTGTITITGGTGRFEGATGLETYVVSVGAGVTSVDAAGTISYQPEANGQALPFQITGGGPAPQGLPLAPFVPGPHYATGTASFLGRYTGSGTFEHDPLVIDPATGLVTANFQGTFTFVAANGDKLVTHYGTGFTGKLTGHLSADGTAVVGVQFDAIFTIDGAQSTGRFAGASGSWRMIAQADSISLASTVPGYSAPFPYTWSGEGSIEFAKTK